MFGVYTRRAEAISSSLAGGGCVALSGSAAGDPSPASVSVSGPPHSEVTISNWAAPGGAPTTAVDVVLVNTVGS